jgi:hypothetical protein
MSTGWYLCIRLTLWLSGVVIAFLPTLVAASDLPADIFGAVAVINSEGLFRDLFFGVVPAAVLAIATVIDYLCVGRIEMSNSAFALALLGIIGNIFVLSAGLIGFLQIPVHASPLTSGPFIAYSALIYVSLLLSLVTEIGVSWSHNNHRRRLSTR